MEQPRHRAPQRRRRKKKKNYRPAIMLTAVILAIFMLIGVGVYVYLDNLVNEGDAGQLTPDIVPTEPEISKKVINLLVAGIDYDSDDDGRDYSDGLGMTDVIMYVSCDIEKGSIRMLQIPRDSYVGENSPTGGTGKINAVYSHGEDSRNRISNLAKVVNEQFKLPVDNYVTIDMAAFKKLIGILGGIEMYVPWDITDPEGNTVPQGTHFVDGNTAEWIVRQRKEYNEGDLKRLEVQQYFYAAVFKTFMTFPMSDLIKVAPGLASYINTALSISEMLSLFGWLQKVDSSNIGIARCPGGSLYETNGHKGMYGINAETLAPLLNEHFRPYGTPVDASELGLPKNLEFPVGEIAASINFIGQLSSAATE